MEHILIYITVPTIEEARIICRDILEERLAACANILPQMESLYWWEGAIQKKQEVVCLFKTRKALFDSLCERVTATHSYDTPCIVALPITHGHAPFLHWINVETGPEE